jgi:hypothetical protein
MGDESTSRNDSRSPIEAMLPSTVPCDIASNTSFTLIAAGTAPKFSAQREKGAPPERRRRPCRSSAVRTGLVVSRT